MIRKKKTKIDERTSGRDDHCTPSWLIVLIHRFGRRGIGLDPAGARKAPVNRYAMRTYHLSRGEDALKLTWRRFGLVFVNPPYGTLVRLWARKAVDDFGYGRWKSLRGDELILLVAARVDTRWFKLIWRHSAAVVLLDRRLMFVGETDPAKFPSALVYYGTRPEQFAKHFGHLGLVLANERLSGHIRQLTTRKLIAHFPGSVVFQPPA